MTNRAEGRRVQKMANNDDKTKDVGFYNAQDGLKGRDGGPYLDHVERQQAEIHRAHLEDREPDDLWGPLPPTAGTTVVPASQVIDNSFTSNPSMAIKPGFGHLLSDKGIADLGEGKPYGEVTEPSTADPMFTATLDLTTDQDADAAHPNVTDVAGNQENKSNSQTLVDSTGKTSDVKTTPNTTTTK